MSTAFKAVEVKKNIYWVGAVDWAIDDFHGYTTPRGSTYNAYLIMDKTVTLIDTVKAPFVDEMLARVASVVDPQKVEIIISNHSEMDHSGGLAETVRRIRPDKVYASKMGVKALAKHHLADDVIAVDDGGTLSIGERELTFIETRMLHWPDSMFTYSAADKVLFSQDAFGMHLATSERFSDEIDPAVMRQEAETYYANILTPFSPLVLKLFEKVKAAGLALDVIAPDHGPIYRTPEEIAKVLVWYAEWAEQKPTMKAVVVYDTMWHSTEKMAQSVADGLAALGAESAVFSLHTRHRSEAMAALLEAGALVVGSPTINNQMFPTVADFLVYARGLKPKNLIGAAFGSYGWSGEGAKNVRKELEAMNVEIVGDVLAVNYVPDADELAACRALGEKVAKRLKEICGK